jgi:hypothetical protein
MNREELRGMVEDMTTSARRGVLGENVARAYKLFERQKELGITAGRREHLL